MHCHVPHAQAAVLERVSLHTFSSLLPGRHLCTNIRSRELHELRQHNRRLALRRDSKYTAQKNYLGVLAACFLGLRTGPVALPNRL